MCRTSDYTYLHILYYINVTKNYSHTRMTLKIYYHSTGSCTNLAVAFICHSRKKKSTLRYRYIRTVKFVLSLERGSIIKFLKNIYFVSSSQPIKNPHTCSYVHTSLPEDNNNKFLKSCRIFIFLLWFLHPT